MEHPQEDRKRLNPNTVFELLEQNYDCLNRKYRAGGFEDKLSVVGNWSKEADTSTFCILCDDPAILSEYEERSNLSWIPFKNAIDELLALAKTANERGELATARGSLLQLRCRILIYESTDYFLRADKGLAAYFVNYVDGFPKTLEELEPEAVKLHGGPFADDKDARAKIVKVQLIAALCGINAKYREHERSRSVTTLDLLEQLTRFIETELPDLHKERRPSFGLLGLAYYLKGRILSSLDLFSESHKAFRRSADAYVARLRQKEEFRRLRPDQLDLAQYKEKVSLTIRRTALVTAFGDGYLSFVASRITDALKSLTLARAALAQNSGQVYVTYVDMLYFACLCAQHSNDGEQMEVVVAGLAGCHSSFEALGHETHYLHRAGLRLATALLFRWQLMGVVSNEDYAKGLDLVDKAIDYSNLNRNKHLLSSALTTKSRFAIAQSQAQPNAEVTKVLRGAEELAKEAHKAGFGFVEKELEASITLGEVYVCQAEMNQDNPELFNGYFTNAFWVLRDALKANAIAGNIRIEAVCFLQLTRLCLLNRTNEALAYQYFEAWEKIKGSVEHKHCHVLARELQPKLGVPFFLVKASELGRKNWEKELEQFTKDHLVAGFVANYVGPTDDKTVGPKLEEYVKSALNCERSTAYKKIKELNLKKRIMELLKERPQA